MSDTPEVKHWTQMTYPEFASARKSYGVQPSLRNLYIEQEIFERIDADLCAKRSERRAVDLTIAELEALGMTVS